MEFLILATLLAIASAAPQVPLNSQVPLQAILLPPSSQVSYSGGAVQGQQGIPAGAQIIYLQSAQPQQQIAYVQGQSQPQGQIAYIQGAQQGGQVSYVQGQSQPQGQIAYIQGAQQGGQVSYVQGPPQGQVIYLQGAPQQQFSTIQTAAPQPQISSFQSTVPQQQSSFPKPPQQSFSPFSNSQSSFSAPKPKPYKPIVSPPVARPRPPTPSYKPSQSYKGSPAPGAPGKPGQGGLKGYVTIRQSQDDDFDGNFRYNYETDHGINVDVVGSVKNQGAEDQIQVIQGSYSYKNPDGTVITTTYTADENGFVAQGDHLPVAPPIPEAIAKALAYIASQPSTDE